MAGLATPALAQDASSACRRAATRRSCTRATSSRRATSARCSRRSLNAVSPARARSAAPAASGRASAQRRQHADHRRRPRHRRPVRRARRVRRGLGPRVDADPGVARPKTGKPVPVDAPDSINVVGRLGAAPRCRSTWPPFPRIPSGNRLEIYGREGALVIRRMARSTSAPSQVHAGKGKEPLAPMPSPGQVQARAGGHAGRPALQRRPGLRARGRRPARRRILRRRLQPRRPAPQADRRDRAVGGGWQGCEGLALAAAHTRPEGRGYGRVNVTLTAEGHLRRFVCALLTEIRVFPDMKASGSVLK